MNPYKAIATRVWNAETNFINYARRVAGLTHAEAVHALNVYKKVKVIKIDAVGGQFTFTHGAFAEAETLRNTITYKL